MKAYSEDLRQKVVQAIDQHGMSKFHTARLFSSSLSSVKCYSRLASYSVVQKGWPLMHDEPSALSNQLFGCQPLKAEGSLLGKVHPFRERL